MIIGIVGYGVVGEAIGINLKKLDILINIYDKYKNIGSFKDILDSDFTFICLPTPFKNNHLDYSSIEEVCKMLAHKRYVGHILIKSTLNPDTIDILSSKYPSLNLVHNPEFLSAKTACIDFKNQKQIILGPSKTCKDISLIKNFYKRYFINANIIVVSCKESAMIKLGANCFYATKIQFFNEIYRACELINIDFDLVKNCIIGNGWVNPMHTNVPGPDGKLSYGGGCFPKDMNGLNNYLKKIGCPNGVIGAAIEEQKIMRK